MSLPHLEDFLRADLRDGRLALGSVNAAPFGVPGEVDLRGIPVEQVA